MTNRSLVLGCLAALLGAAPAHAQNDSDFELLYRQTNALPNIVIMLDDSGSMSNSLWASGFNPKVFYDTTAVQNACNNDQSMNVSPLADTTGFCPGAGAVLGTSRTDCPDNEGNNYSGNSILRCLASQMPPSPCSYAPAGWTCNVTTGSPAKVELTLPDYSFGTARTRWSVNYLDWIIGEMKNTRKPVIPQTDRLQTAKTVIKDAIDRINDPNQPVANEKARFGLWGFNALSQGGSLKQAVASNQRAALRTAIDNMVASNFTPLAETLADISRYMSGNQAIGVSSNLGSGTITAGNPMNTASCAKNFVIMLTDGESTQDQFDHPPYLGKIGTAIGDADGDRNTFEDRAGTPPYVTNGSDWLDDIAAYIFKNDLRPNTLSSGALPGTQNIVTYVVGYTIDHPLLKNSAEDGGGAYFVASSAEALTTSINSAIDDILLRSASFSAASIPSTRTNTDDALFTAFFEPSGDMALWTGHLQAYEIGPNFEILGANGQPATDSVTGEFLEPRDTHFWDSQLCLSVPTKSCFVTTRKLYHGFGTPAVRNDFTAANLTAGQMNVLASELSLYPNDPNTNLPFTNADTLADSIVNYLRGEDAFDLSPRNGNKTERRPVVLGDIFHSSPLAIGGVSFFLAGEAGYGPIDRDPSTPASPQSFYDLYYSRRRVIYTGANDGMYHAFNAGSFVNPDAKPLSGDESYTFGTGAEEFGYVFRESLPTLKNIVKKGVSKPFYVDGSPAASDAWLPSSATDTTKNPSEWTTVSVVGMRNGGDAYLALDITDPNATSGAHGPYPKLLWEFGDPAELMGASWSTPIITRVKIKAGVTGDFCGPNDGDGAVGTGSADCRETWVAIFGGGYREQADPSLTTKFIGTSTTTGFSADSRSIYIVELKTGAVLARAAFNASDTKLNKMIYAIPSTPAVADLNFDGFADVIYVGDAGGQLWKWDISKVAAKGTGGLVSLTDWPIDRFFVAPPGSNGHRRPIFYPPSLSFVNRKLTLAFGTGERTLLDYDSTTTNADENHFYVIRDLAPTGTAAFTGAPHAIGELTLLAPTQNTDSNLNDLGFYIKAQNDGKFVTDTVAFGGFAITLAYEPDIGNTAAVCEKGGSAILYIFNLSDGTGFFADQGTGEAARRVKLGRGLPTSPRVSQLGQNVNIVVQTSTGQLLKPKGPKDTVPPVQMIYWRQQQ